MHEYGGGAYCVHRGTVYFSNFDDQRLYRQEIAADPVADHAGHRRPRIRYADGRVTADGSLVLCVRERHEADGEVVNELAAVPTDGRRAAHDRRRPRLLRRAADLARRLEARLAHVGPPAHAVGRHRAVGRRPRGRRIGERRATRVAGGAATESIFQPAWSPDGELHFVSDRTGWWNLYRQRDGADEPLCPREAEFGWPHWVFGASMYAFLADGRIVCEYTSEGVQHLALLDPASGELLDLDLPYSAIGYPYLSAEGSHARVRRRRARDPARRRARSTSRSRAVEVLRESEQLAFDPGYVSVPRSIAFPTEGGLTAFANFYPPANPEASPARRTSGRR